VSANSIIREIHEHTHGGEQNCEYSEAHKLDGLSSPRVDEEEGGIVSREKTSSGKNEIAHTDILQVVVDTNNAFNWGSTEADRLQDNTRVETETVKCDLSVRTNN
jgi:hypothetical protein